jgi:hypothetical protein
MKKYPMSVTYGDLFDFLRNELDHRPCDNTLHHTKAFAEQHGLFFGELAQTLNDFGGYCDCEVLLNVFARGVIDTSVGIGQESFKTPVQYAIDNGWYCTCRVTGEPGSAEESSSAGAWIPCKGDDPFAVPDLNRAILAMQVDDDAEGHDED